MVVYFISGLGADRRLFQKLHLPVGVAIKYLDWIPPLPGETLPAYAKRLAKDIDANEEFSLVGLSFGGMIATEIAKILHPKYTILISSVSRVSELPSRYTIPGRLRLHTLIPSFLLQTCNSLVYDLFGAKSQEERTLLKQVIKDSDTSFVKWAINAILRWRNNERPRSIYHIHGDKDLVLPIANVACDHKIAGGGHLMVFTHADEIGKIIEDRLAGF